MRTFLLISGLLACILSSCVKNNTPTTPLDNTVDTTVAMGGNAGNFINGPYGSVSGSARIYDLNGMSILALQNMSISNGPDLHVYLSYDMFPSENPINYLNLGRLQSTMGNQLYNIPSIPNLNQYRYALVHCKRYNHLFGSALLQ